ncbi:MAG: hypothetical protein HY023_03585, partial [Chloroflexi bacterium]|nr:hypothetical protein [Chloroflexota bacterium]
IIDLGSNSARLIVAHYTPKFAFRIADEFTRRVRLSEGMAADSVLRPVAVERTLAMLRVFRAFCDAHGVSRVIPTATAAVRHAVNGAEFLSRVQAETGWKFRVLTGEEEARLGVIARQFRWGQCGSPNSTFSTIRSGRSRLGVSAIASQKHSACWAG